jgi:hypothetical protein
MGICALGLLPGKGVLLSSFQATAAPLNRYTLTKSFLKVGGLLMYTFMQDIIVT